MKKTFVTLAVALLLGACGSDNAATDAIADAAAGMADGTVTMTRAIEIADSLCRKFDRYSPEAGARIQGAIVYMVNTAVDADSVDIAERAMRLYLANHDAMTNRDSTAWASATADVQTINGYLNTPAIVDRYRRSIVGLETLRNLPR